MADLKEAAAYESPNSINVTAKADVDTIKLKKDHLGLVYKGNLDLSSLNSSSEDDNDDMFTTAKHKDNTSSRHSSNDDLSAIHRNAFISPTKRILKPPLLNIGTISEPVHSNRTAHLSRDNAFEKSEVPSLKTQVNILSGIEKDMFAPRQSNDAMSSRISVRSASDSVLMEAIYDDDYYDSEIRGEDDTVHDIIPVDEYDVQFKRSEKLSSATNKLLGHEQLSAKGNSIAKKQSLFNSEFDEETEVIFLADLPGEEMSEDDSSSDGLPALQEPVAPHWSIFRPKVDKPEDRELLSLPDISSINYQEDVVEMKSPEVYQSSCIQAPTPTAAWKASAAAGTDNGVNLTAYQEETTSLQGEDTFLLVDYSDPMDTGRPEVKWFDGKEQLAAARINPHHIPVLVSAEEAEDIEAVPPKIIVKVKMSVKFQLLHGYDWSTSQNSNSSQLRKLLLKQGSAAKTALSMPHSFFGTAAKNRGAHRVLFPEDTLKPSPSYSSKDAKSKYSMSATDSNKDKAELSLHGVCVRFAMYAPDEVSIATWPVQRTIVKINDIDVKFYRKNHRTKKVLGYWKSQVPRETNAPILHVHLDTFVETVSKSHGSESRYSTVGAINSAGVVSNSESAKFDSDHDIEHVNKISIVLLPLSCHLDGKLYRYILMLLILFISLLSFSLICSTIS